MQPKSPVFEQTCQRYLSEIADIDFRRIEAWNAWLVGMLLADRLKQMLLHI